MKKLNRKGFTIVELVVVVAIIAILASALIPTFVGLVNRANLSADIQAARQMTSTLAVLAAEDAEIEDVLDALLEENYNIEALVPLSQNHAFYWYKEYNTVVLVKTVDGASELVFPENNEKMANDFEADLAAGKVYNLAQSFREVPVEAATSAQVEELISAGVGVITLTNDVKLANEIVVAKDAEVVINLAGNTFDASAISTRPFYVSAGSNANITVNAEGSEIKCAEFGLVDFRGNNTGSFTVNGGTITADLNWGALVKVRSGANVTVTFNNVTYTDVATDSYIVNSQGTANVVVNGGRFESALGFQVTELTMTGATVTTDAYAVLVTKSATIDNCTITSASKAEKELTGDVNATVPAGAVQVQSGATATINNSTVSVTGASAANESAPLVFCSSGGKFVVNSTVLKTNATETYHVHKGGYTCTFVVVVDGVTVLSDSFTK